MGAIESKLRVIPLIPALQSERIVKLALFRGKSIFKAHLIFLFFFSKRGLTSEPFNLKSQAFAQVRAMPFNIPVDNFNETYMVSRAEVRYIKISHRNDIKWFSGGYTVNV